MLYNNRNCNNAKMEQQIIPKQGLTVSNCRPLSQCNVAIERRQAVMQNTEPTDYDNVFVIIINPSINI